MNSNVTLDALRPEDHDAVARLLHRSLVHWYQSRLNQGARFGDSHEPFRLFPEVYEALDPGQAVAARDAVTGELLGGCFIHPRETHFAVHIPWAMGLILLGVLSAAGGLLVGARRRA